MYDIPPIFPKLPHNVKRGFIGMPYNYFLSKYYFKKKHLF